MLIADYKTNHPAPRRPEDAPDYVTQLALYRAVLAKLYPGHEIPRRSAVDAVPDLMALVAAGARRGVGALHPCVTPLDAARGASYVPGPMPRRPLVARSEAINEVPMAVEKVSDASFESDVLKATGPVVVDFWAEWCGPCRMIAPALEEIAGSLGDKVKILKLNVDENPATAAKYGIMSIPTLMIFKNGEMASRQVGAAPKQKLEQWITAAV